MSDLLLPDQGFPMMLRLSGFPHFDRQLLTLLNNKAPAKCGGLLLPDQGSNLESSDPESDVLPIPPSGIVFIHHFSGQKEGAK